MRLYENPEVLVETTDPKYASGIRHAWISRRTVGLIVGHGAAETEYLALRMAARQVQANEEANALELKLAAVILDTDAI